MSELPVAASLLFDTHVNAAAWRFNAENLASIRSLANRLGCSRALAKREGRESSIHGPPRCLGGRHKYLSLPGAPTGAGNSVMSVHDETTLKRWYEEQIGALCGRRAMDTRLKRSSKVAASAIMLFKRFFLSHSLLECDPLTVSLCAVFCASKLEDEFISASDVARSNSGDDDDRRRVLEREIMDLEPILLAGVNYDLRLPQPHRLLRILATEAALASRARDVIDDMYATDAPLLHAPSTMALAAIFVVDETMKSQLGAKFDLGSAILLEASDLARSHRASRKRKPEELTAAAKPIRKRLKKLALWRQEKPAADDTAAATPVGGGADEPPEKRRKV